MGTESQPATWTWDSPWTKVVTASAGRAAPATSRRGDDVVARALGRQPPGQHHDSERRRHVDEHRPSPSPELRQEAAENHSGFIPEASHVSGPVCNGAVVDHVATDCFANGRLSEVAVTTLIVTLVAATVVLATSGSSGEPA